MQVAKPDPSTPNATLKRSFVTTLLVAALVVGGLGIGAAASVPGMQVGGWLALTLFALLAAPLLYLLWRQWTRPGAATMVLTAGTALTSLAGLLPISYVFTIFSGFATSLKQVYWLFCLWGLLVLLLVIGLAAFSAQKRLRAQGAPAGWPSAIAVPLLYVVVAHGAVAAVARLEADIQANTRQNQYRASAALRDIKRCATEAAAQAGAAGYPSTLAALGPSGTRCLDAELAAGRRPGYIIEYLASPPDANGRIATYTTCARPAAPTHGGLPTMAGHADKQAVVENGDPARAAPMSCSQVWQLERSPALTLYSLSACAIRYAHEHPQIGYPATVADLAAIACELAYPATLVYRPGPGGQGPRRSFEALATGSIWGRSGSYFIDESGVLRFAAQGDAGRDAPALNEITAAEGAAVAATERQRLNQLAAAGQETLAACDRGEALGCDRYGEHAMFNLKRADEAERYFRRACDAGHTPSCLSFHSGDAAENETYQIAIWLRHHCRDGQARACESLTQLHRGMDREATRKVQEWVLAGPQ